MIITLDNLKQFIYYIKDRNINYMRVKSSKVEIHINKNKKDNYNRLILNKNLHNSNLQEKIYKKNKYNEDLKSKSINNHKTKQNFNSNNQEIETYSTIISPMVGTFYRSPAPNELPFVEKKRYCTEKTNSLYY